MDLESALQQYLIEAKETAPREQVELDLVVLARLQEYLEEGAPYASQGSTQPAEAVSAADLREFIEDWYRSGEDVTPETAREVVRAITGFAAWLDRQLADPGSTDPSPPFGRSGSRAAELSPLEEDLPRAARAAAALRAYARRHDLAEDVAVGSGEGPSPLGILSAGAQHVMRPAEVDYSRAEEDTFVIVQVDEHNLALTSPSRETLGEGPAAPVAVPARAARLLRPGDRLYAEIAPTATGWEILHVVTVYPGGSR